MKKNKIKGLNTPNWIVGIWGFCDARIRKIAGVDPNSGLLVSGYITGKSSQFHAYEAQKVDNLENEVKAVRTEAGELVTEYAQLRRRMEPMPMVPDPGDIARVRQYQRAEARNRAAVARCDEIGRRMAEIEAKLQDREHHVLQELRHAKGVIRSKFAAYGHGMMLRPVDMHMIPELDLAGSLEIYHEVHREEDARIQRIIEEVHRYE